MASIWLNTIDGSSAHWAHIFDTNDGKVWNTNSLSFETWTNTNFLDYVLNYSAVNSPISPNGFLYTFDFPTDIPKGNYWIHSLIGSSVGISLASGFGSDSVYAVIDYYQWTGVELSPPFSNLYLSNINLVLNSTTDDYTVSWFKNGVRLETGITSPTIQVIKRSDGTDLLISSVLSEIGSTGVYNRLENTSRMPQGSNEAYVVVVSATIDGATRSYSKIIGLQNARVVY